MTDKQYLTYNRVRNKLNKYKVEYTSKIKRQKKKKKKKAQYYWSKQPVQYGQQFPACVFRPCSANIKARDNEYVIIN